MTRRSSRSAEQQRAFINVNQATPCLSANRPHRYGLTLLHPRPHPHAASHAPTYRTVTPPARCPCTAHHIRQHCRAMLPQRGSRFTRAPCGEPPALLACSPEPRPIQLQEQLQYIGDPLCCSDQNCAARPRAASPHCSHATQRQGAPPPSFPHAPPRPSALTRLQPRPQAYPVPAHEHVGAAAAGVRHLQVVKVPVGGVAFGVGGGGRGRECVTSGHATRARGRLSRCQLGESPGVGGDRGPGARDAREGRCKDRRLSGLGDRD